MAFNNDLRDILAIGQSLRDVFLPLWEKKHTKRLAETPQDAEWFPTPSALHCVSTCMAMGASSTLRANAEPGEPGFLLFAQGWVRHPTHTQHTWHPHSWLSLGNGLSLDITADQFGYPDVHITPEKDHVFLSKAETALWDAWDFPKEDTPLATHVRAHKLRAGVLKFRNTANQWLRDIHRDPKTSQTFIDTLHALRDASAQSQKARP